jgi:tetratricopeptide (TPR) repeat protein
VLARPAEAVPPALPLVTPTPAPTPLQYQEDPLAHAKDLEAQGRHGEALAAYELEAKEHPDLLGAWRGVADLNYHLGDKARAIAAFEKVLELKPDPDLEKWLEQFRQEP